MSASRQVLPQPEAEFSRVSILSQAVREFGHSLQPKCAQGMTANLQRVVEEMRPMP